MLTAFHGLINEFANLNSKKLKRKADFDILISKNINLDNESRVLFHVAIRQSLENRGVWVLID